MSDTPGRPATPRRVLPRPLLGAVALVVLEGLALIGYGGSQIFAVSGARLTMGVTTLLFFLVYGAGLLVCGWALSRLKAWSRGPVVLAQLIQLGVAWSFWGGGGTGTTVVAALLAVVALLVCAGVLLPSSTAALVGT